jgi:glucokinase
VLDLKKVILGGGLSLAFDLYRDTLMETVYAQTYKRPYPSPEILATPLRYEGALYGAAALALARAAF